jgi:hypothetical protein
VIARWTVAIILAFVAAIVLFALISTVQAKDKGYFDCFQLSAEQKKWFAQQPMKGCCELSDGQPTPYELRSDAYYIPPYSAPKLCEANESKELNKILNDKSTWVRVPSDRIKKVKNEIGFGVVWWENAGNNSYPPPSHNPRCFVPIADN